MKQAARARILAALTIAPGTQADLCSRANVSLPTCSRWCAHLRACAEAHISGWTATAHGGPPSAVYSAGPGADVICSIKPLTQRQRDRRSRRLRRQSGAWEDRKAAERARYWAAKAARRDVLTAAFFGGASC